MIGFFTGYRKKYIFFLIFFFFFFEIDKYELAYDWEDAKRFANTFKTFKTFVNLWLNMRKDEKGKHLTN